MNDYGDHGQNQKNVDCKSGGVIDDEAANPGKDQDKRQQQPYKSHFLPLNLRIEYAAELWTGIKRTL